MAAQATSGAALAVIKRMFEDPIPRLLPSQTSVRQLIEGDRYDSTYCPDKWADPLLLYKWQLGGEEDTAEFMPETGVSCYTKFGLVAQPDLSVFGKKLKTMYESTIEYESLADFQEEVEYIVKSPEFWLARLLYEESISSNLKDEAAIVRLFLLKIMLSKPTDLLQASSLVQQIAVNMNVNKDGCTSSWSLPPEISNSQQIGTETSSSALYVVPIDEFLTNSAPLPFVYIPVMRRWRGRSWLMAYILSFTSTSWWNHAYTLDVEYSNGVPEATEGLPMKATFMPKAATVRIPGNHKYICLVVVDVTRAELPDNWEFEVCKGISATTTGNLEFAKKAHAYLGRLSDPDVKVISDSDISNALDTISQMFSSAELRQLHLKASILATSRFNGFGCYPNPEPPKNRKHIIGPAAFNNKDEIVIGDYVLPDLAKMEEEGRRERLQNLNFWRCDPLGFYSTNTSQCGDQYRLSVSFIGMRILRACGVFAPVSKEGCRIWGVPQDYLNTTLGYASLMLGLTNWYFVEMGCTLFEHNYILREPIYLNESQHLLPKITDFVIDFESEMEAERWLVNLRKIGEIMNISEPEHPERTDWTNTHFSGNVPWWFVGAIAAQFGHSFKIKTPVSVLKDEIGWWINGTSGGQYDLSLLTASSKYELKVRRNHGPYFPIRTLNSERTGLTHNMVSWDMNRVLDKKKMQLGREGFSLSRGFVDYNGIVELNVLILPKAHYSESYAFVASDNRIIAEIEKTWPQVSGLNWFYGGHGYLDWLGTVSETEKPELS